MLENDQDDALKKWAWDLEHLRGMALNAAYKREYSSWKNMNQRAKSDLCQVMPEFRTFVGFLRGMGRPMPPGKHTVDRLDNNLRTYGPGLCDWKTPKQQANNRSTTRQLTIAGRTAPLSTWAEETNQKPDTLRKRLARGWSDDEVVSGGSETDTKRPKWPGAQEAERLLEWERRYSTRPEREAYETRLQFFIRHLKVRLTIEVRSLEDRQAMASFLEAGTVPPAYGDTDMDAWYQAQFDGLEPSNIRASLATTELTIDQIHAHLAEAGQMQASGQDSSDLEERMRSRAR